MEEFAQCSNRDAAKVALLEKGGKGLVTAADFWWNYPVGQASEFEKPFRQHAAKLYDRVISAGKLVGLNKIQAERRIEEVKALGETMRLEGEPHQTSTASNGLYCIVDLSAGPDAKKYPVSYLNDVPKGGWSDEYKTAKLVLKRVEPKDKPAYYLGVFEVTGDQWGRVMGKDPSQFFAVPNHPVDHVSYQDIRGKEKGCAVPVTAAVDEGSFLARIRARTGLKFDLPQEDQWEYACRANSYGAWGAPAMNDVEKFKKMAWYGDSGDATKNGPGNSEGHTHGVGEKTPNDWGFYGMHGNVWELTVGVMNDDARVSRGAGWWHCSTDCTSTARAWGPSDFRWHDIGFRLAIQPE